MGRTDGENIERGWAWMNPASLSTREMGPGARHDTLDDQWQAWNYQRVVRFGECDVNRLAHLLLISRLGTTLHRRLDESVQQAQKQREIHNQFTRTFRPSVVEEWNAQVDAWQEDPFNKDIPNPFAEPEPDVSMADLRRQLNEEESGGSCWGDRSR